MRADQLIIALFQRFCWMDEGLQTRLRNRGWPEVSRPQSMVMTNIVRGIVRPSEIARNLGVSRQAVHNTLSQMEKLGMIRLQVDPDDRRHHIVALTEKGLGMRHDALRAMDELAGRITEALGQDRFAELLAALEADWGDNMEGAAPPREPAVRP